MVFIGFFLLICATMGAVFVPWLLPFLLLGIRHLIDLGIHPVIIIFVCAITATMTTTGMWFLDNYLHDLFAQKKKNNSKKKGLSRKMRRFFDRRLSTVSNRYILFVAMVIASGSLIPDIFLVEFGRIKMKFHCFISAIMIGKFATYTIMLLGIDTIVGFFQGLIGMA